ncbi:MAG: hypothetical protein AB4040_09670 [Synechococcus sp.]
MKLEKILSVLMYGIPFAADAPLTDAQFVELCWSNPDIICEVTAKGELAVTSPTGG